MYCIFDVKCYLFSTLKKGTASPWCVLNQKPVVTVRICFATPIKIRQKFGMKFVNERRHQPQQGNVSGDSFTHFLPRVGQRENRFGQVCPGMEG